MALVTELGGVRFYDDSKGTNVGAAVTAVRGRVPYYDGDRYFAPDIEKVAELVRGGTFRASFPGDWAVL